MRAKFWPELANLFLFFNFLFEEWRFAKKKENNNPAFHNLFAEVA